MTTNTEALSLGSYVLRSFAQFKRLHLAVALGVLVGTAVLTGALLMGDSVRHSLQRLTMERLGRIDSVVIADHFFSESLLARVQSNAGSSITVPSANPPAAANPAVRATDVHWVNLSADTGFVEAAGVILLPQVTVENPANGNRRSQRTGQVTLVGCDPRFWQLGHPVKPPSRNPNGQQIVINQPLAEELHASIGDKLIVRIGKDDRIAADSTMAHKDDRLQTIAELEVVDIVPAQGLGRFSLQANQALPRTAYLPLETIQRSLDLPEKLNAILFAADPQLVGDPNENSTVIHQLIQPSLEDAGLRLKHVQQTYQPEGEQVAKTTFEYWNLTSDSMLFSPESKVQLDRALLGLQFETALTYLANSIFKVPPSSTSLSAAIEADPDLSIPYSTVTAIDTQGPLNPLQTPTPANSPQLADDEIALNQWAAEDLGAKPGDTIRLTFFAPETTHGDPQEHSADFRLSAIVPLTKPASPFRRRTPARYAEPPTRANDPDFTPEVPGITDQDSIDSWDPPFPFDYKRIRKPKDDDYWADYRTTPKAFISQRAGEKLWRSRFGQVSSYRIAISVPSMPGRLSEAELRTRIEKTIRESPESFGFTFLPVKRDGLLAAKGTTPFQFLFLGFSMFLIAASLMLVALLFRLSLEQRAREIGLLSAVGFSPNRIMRLFLGEGLLVSTVGAVLGAILGIGYAALMIAGLRTWWLDAVVTPFVNLYVGRFTIPLGILLGTLAGLFTIYLSLRGVRNLEVRNMLGGSLQIPANSRGPASRWGSRALAGLWLVAVVLLVSAGQLQGEAQAGAFFGGGVLVLTALLWHVRRWLTRPSHYSRDASAGFGLIPFVTRNLGRNPGRSTLTLGLMATACFLIVAISAFRLSPTDQGTGGFNLIAQSDQPLFDDLQNAEVRRELWGERAGDLQGVTLGAARLRDGDDASCRNLYQVQQPRILGLPDSLTDTFAQPDQPTFAFASTLANTAEERANPWILLRSTVADDPIPVILDKNTAMYSLHLYGGSGQEFELDYGTLGTKRFRIVGLLSNSVLQGSLITSESQLLRHFPDVSGYRFLFIRSSAQNQAAVRDLLETRYSDQGLETIDTKQLLAELLAVQNTYLSTFQSLGGLGLLLGTLGLVAVQLRNVLERRSELALLQACGFRHQRIGELVLLEHLMLLLGGLGVGLFAAFLTVLPQAWTTDVQPPWLVLAGILGVIVLVGILTGLLILRPVVKAPLVAALRGD